MQEIKNNKFNSAFSPVMGVIITVVIVVAIAGTVYFYLQMSAEDIDKSDTSYISLSPTPIFNTKNASINVDSAVRKKVDWDEIYFILVDIDEAKELEDGNEVNIVVPQGNVTSGNIISIKSNDSDYLIDNHRYRFTIYHSKNEILLGNAEWTQ